MYSEGTILLLNLLLIFPSWSDQGTNSSFACVGCNVHVNPHEPPHHVVVGNRGDIYNGQFAQPESYPYTVMIDIINPQGQHQLCSGALFTAFTVITAAHCMFYSGKTMFDISNVTVYAGANYGYGFFGTPKKVEKFIPNPAYNGSWVEGNQLNDIGLIILTEPYTFDDTIGTIDIPFSDQKLPNGTNCTLAAFGSSGVDKPYAGLMGFLQYAFIPLLSDSDCQGLYLPSTFSPKTSVCAGGRGGPSSCGGDSGGPLVCPYPPFGTKFLYGTVTGSRQKFPTVPGVPCSDPSPGVYEFVPYHTDFIRKNAKVI